MKLLRKALIEGSFLLDLDARDMASILRQTIDYVVVRGVLPAEMRDDVEEGLLQREQQVSTAIGNAVAVPHTYLDAFSEPIIVFVRLSHAINLGAPDGVPTRFLFVLLGPTGAAVQHLDSLAGIARLMSDDEFRYDAGTARTQLDFLTALDRFNERTGPPAEPHKEHDVICHELTYSRRLFGGLVADVRRRLPHYASDLRDGMHSKCLASTLFCFLPVWLRLSRSAASWGSLPAIKLARSRCWSHRLFAESRMRCCQDSRSSSWAERGRCWFLQHSLSPLHRYGDSVSRNVWLGRTVDGFVADRAGRYQCQFSDAILYSVY